MAMGKLFKVGLLLSKSSRIEYLKRMTFECDQEDCVSTLTLDEDQVLEVQSLSPMDCPECGSAMNEDVKQRLVSSKVLLTFVSWPRKAEAKLSQSFQALIEEKLDVDLGLGDVYEVHGRTVVQGPSDFWLCFNLYRLGSWYERIARSKMALPMPMSLFKATKTVPSTPWSLVQSMVWMFGSGIAAPTDLVRIKLAILFSLVSGANTPISLLVAGEDTTKAHRLMTLALDLTEKSIIHGTNSGSLTPTVSQERQGLTMINSGSLLLASDGVLYLGDLARSRNSDLDELAVVLETKRVKATNGSLFMESDLRTTVWASLALTKTATKGVDPSDGIDHFLNKGKPIRNSVKKVKQVVTLLLPSELDTTFDFNDYSLDKGGDDVCIQMLKEFLCQIRRRRIEVRKEAQDLMKRYFVASRRWRGIIKSSDDARELPQTSLQTLSLLAEAHAKLSLHESVLVSDALAAIRFYEELITDLFKTSSFMTDASSSRGSKPSRLADQIQEHQDQMKVFWTKLTDFIHFYSTDVAFEE